MYMSICVCICSRVNIWSKISGPSVASMSGPRYVSLLFPRISECFGGMFKITDSEWGAKIAFPKIVGMSKMRFSKSKQHFCLFYLFRVGERKTKKKKNQKGYCNKCPEIVCFRVGRRSGFFQYGFS